MAEYSYIHIALRGPVQGATRTIYSYPADDTSDAGWETAMVEPGAAVKRFLNKQAEVAKQLDGILPED